MEVVALVSLGLSISALIALRKLFTISNALSSLNNNIVVLTSAVAKSDQQKTREEEQTAYQEALEAEYVRRGKPSCFAPPIQTISSLSLPRSDYGQLDTIPKLHHLDALLTD